MDDIMTICFWWLFIITNSLLDNLILVPPNFLDFLKVFRKKSQWSRRSLTTLVTLFFGFPPYFLGDILKNIGLSEQNGLCRWPPWFVGASLLWTLWTSCSRSNLFQGPTQKVSFLSRLLHRFILIGLLSILYVYHHILLNLTLSHQKNYMNFVHIKRKILLTTRSVF